MIRKSTTAIRRERQVAATRRDILVAAARCFAASGYEGATMSQIAAAAGFTAASLYTYYRGKAEILAAMLEFFETEILATFDTPIPHGLGFEQRLELLLATQLRLIDERRELMMVFAMERARTSVHKERGIETYTRMLTAWMRRAGGKSAFGKVPTDVAAFLIVGIAHAVYLRWMAGGAKTRLEVEAATVVDFFLHGVRGKRRMEIVK